MLHADGIRRHRIEGVVFSRLSGIAQCAGYDRLCTADSVDQRHPASQQGRKGGGEGAPGSVRLSRLHARR